MDRKIFKELSRNKLDKSREISREVILGIAGVMNLNLNFNAKPQNREEKQKEKSPFKIWHSQTLKNSLLCAFAPLR